IAGHRYVDDDEVRLLSLVGRLERTLRGPHYDGITRLAQPALEQAEDQIVWFDDKYVPLLLHKTSAGRSLKDSVSIRETEHTPGVRCPFETTHQSGRCNNCPHFCQLTQSVSGRTRPCDTSRAFFSHA